MEDAKWQYTSQNNLFQDVRPTGGGVQFGQFLVSQNDG
jgi:hypothetical protein